MSSPSGNFFWYVFSKYNCLYYMIPIFLLVQKLKCDFTSKWPLELVIKFTSHQTYKHREVHTFTRTIIIGINSQAYLIAIGMGVEMRRVPNIILFLVFSKVSHGKLSSRRFVDASEVCGIMCQLPTYANYRKYAYQLST